MIPLEYQHQFGLIAHQDAIGNGETYYSVTMPSGVEKRECDDGLFLAILNDECNLRWVMLEVVSRSDDETLYDVLAHGHGPSAHLREPRHTYIGNDGYLFYVKPRLLTWCFEQLTEWFDFDA